MTYTLLSGQTYAHDQRIVVEVEREDGARYRASRTAGGRLMVARLCLDGYTATIVEMPLDAWHPDYTGVRQAVEAWTTQELTP